MPRLTNDTTFKGFLGSRNPKKKRKIRKNVIFYFVGHFKGIFLIYFGSVRV